MNVKNAFCIIILLFILFSAVTLVSASDDKSYTIDQGLIELTVKDNGLLHVDEQYDYAFKGEYNGVYRDIPLKEGESIKNIKVSADGAYPLLEEIDHNGEKRLKIYLFADPEHTQKIRDCKVSVNIHYDMENVVTLFNDVGALQFKLWGEDWDVGVEKLYAQVNLPGDKNNIYYLDPLEYNVTSELKGDKILAESTAIPKGEYYEVLVLMPLSDFNNNANYAKHVNQDGKDMIVKNHNDSISSRSFWNTTYLILGLLSLLSPISAAIIYLRYGREPEVNYEGIYERELPSNDPPEVINAIIENKHNIGTPNIKGFESSVMNLIDRKVFRIFTETDANTETNNLLITFNNEKENELNSSEKIVFNTLKHFSYDNMLNMSKLNGKLTSKSEAKWFQNQIKNWTEDVKNKIDTPYYFDSRGSDWIGIIFLLGIIFGIIITVLGFMTDLGNGIYARVGGIILIIFSVALFAFPNDIFGRWTENGRLFYLKWNNFKKFLKDNSLIKEHPPESIVIWKKYLIYGAALGVAEEVYKSMKLQVPNISDYDDGVFRYHYYGGYGMMYSAYNTSDETLHPSSDSSGSFGSSGGGSGGGGGGAF